MAENFVLTLNLSSGGEYYQKTSKLELIGETRAYTDCRAAMFEVFSYLEIIYNKRRTTNKQNTTKTSPSYAL